MEVRSLPDLQQMQWLPTRARQRSAVVRRTWMFFIEAFASRMASAALPSLERHSSTLTSASRARERLSPTKATSLATRQARSTCSVRPWRPTAFTSACAADAPRLFATVCHSLMPWLKSTQSIRVDAITIAPASVGGVVRLLKVEERGVFSPRACGPTPPSLGGGVVPCGGGVPCTAAGSSVRALLSSSSSPGGGTPPGFFLPRATIRSSKATAGPSTRASTTMAPAAPRRARQRGSRRRWWGWRCLTKRKRSVESHSAATTRSSIMPCSSFKVERRHSTPSKRRPSRPWDVERTARSRTPSASSLRTQLSRTTSTWAPARARACERTTSTRSASWARAAKFVAATRDDTSPG
mmetsp:Transcript_316/g.1158  ORF Transcript_316/g.1158 Transcript_316/m.1158 type:complete len:353 (+) Transcript_316:1010-2068(+)